MSFPEPSVGCFCGLLFLWTELRTSLTGISDSGPQSEQLPPPSSSLGVSCPCAVLCLVCCEGGVGTRLAPSLVESEVF